MKRFLVLGLLVGIGCGLFFKATGRNVLGADAQEAEQAKRIRLALQNNQPSEHHKWLDALVGEWDTEWKVWLTPGNPPEDVTKGRADFAWTMDRRFVRGKFSGEMMGGKKYDAELVIGYNPLRKQFDCTWINSFEVAMARYSGEAKHDGVKLANLTLTGTQDNCATGEMDVKCRAVFSFANSDRIVEELYATDKEGKEYKAVEITYSRAKK